MSTHLHQEASTEIFIASLYIIIQPWKQPKYTSTVVERINKYDCTMEYVEAIEIKEVNLRRTTWIKLTNIILKKLNIPNYTCSVIPFI